MEVRLPHICTINNRPFLLGINKGNLPCGQRDKFLNSVNCHSRGVYLICPYQRWDELVNLQPSYVLA